MFSLIPRSSNTDVLSFGGVTDDTVIVNYLLIKNQTPAVVFEKYMQHVILVTQLAFAHPPALLPGPC